MTGIPGVMAKIIKALSDSNIEVLQTADSHMTIWCLIHTDNVQKAINTLHRTFELS
ncbi:aspartate kinase I [compost metagenome]